jgi:tetratricopeptide (TPR) repeat protein
LGRYEEADECFDEFFRRIDMEIKANPRDINLLRAKAVTLASIGERREALDLFLKIEQINPNAEFLEEDLRRLGF